MTDAEKILLSDAIETSIETEHKLIKCKRIIGGLSVVILILIYLLIIGG